ncbi:MAG: hypothetical protein U1E70_16655 [Acetobacteraceae bacterium]
MLLAVAWRESGFSTTAAPGNGSTASGMFQFTEDAWLDAIRIYGAKHGLAGYANLLRLEDSGTSAVSDRARRRVLDLRRGVGVSAAMAAETMAGERGELEDDLGRPTRPADLYFRHLLGPAGSRRFLPAVAATPSVSSEEYLGRIARGNPIIFYRDGKPLSLGEAYANVAAMLDERMIMYGDQVRQHHVTSKAAGNSKPPERNKKAMTRRHEAPLSLKAQGRTETLVHSAKTGPRRKALR